MKKIIILLFLISLMFLLSRPDIAAKTSTNNTLWEWNTFMGGSGIDRGQYISIDSNGNIYVVGQSTTTWGIPVNGFTKDEDVFVAKLDNNGIIQWNTFMGTGGWDDGRSVAVDNSGNVYVTGYSMYNWGSPINPHAAEYGNWDVFIAKLNSSGVMQWNTFLGGTSNDAGYGIVVDVDGNVYVTGSSSSDWGNPINAYAGGTSEIFVAKLNNSGVLQWNTFYGGTFWDSWDEGEDIVLDNKGNIFITGYSKSWGSPINTYAGGISDIFVAKLNNSGILQWNTFMGSSSENNYEERGLGIDLDKNCSIYITGYSDANWGSTIRDYSGSWDAFTAKLDSNGVLRWNTFLGSGDSDVSESIAVDGSGNIYIVGYSNANWDLPVKPHKGITNAFSTKLNSSGVIQWHTFIGDTTWSSRSFGRSIAVDNSGNIYIAGESHQSWGSPVTEYSGGISDAFAVKFNYNNITGLQTGMDLPEGYKLFQNYPNPFNPITKISYSISHSNFVSLKIYDIVGKEIKTLVSEVQDANTYSVNFDADKLSSGIYFYKLQVGNNFVETKKMLLIQ